MSGEADAPGALGPRGELVDQRREPDQQVRRKPPLLGRQARVKRALPGAQPLVLAVKPLLPERGQRDRHATPIMIGSRPAYDPPALERVEDAGRGRSGDSGLVGELEYAGPLASGEALEQPVLGQRQRLLVSLRGGTACAPNGTGKLVERAEELVGAVLPPEIGSRRRHTSRLACYYLAC